MAEFSLDDVAGMMGGASAAPAAAEFSLDDVGKMLGTTPASASQKTGLGANIAAGAVEGGSGVLNVLADPVGNLIGKPLAIAATTAHDFLAPMFGYEKFTPEQRAFFLGDQVPQIGTRVADTVGSAVGAPSLEQVQPDGVGEGMARAATSGAVMLPMLNLAGAAPSALNTLLAIPMGAAGGAIGTAAKELVPPEYAPAAELAGNVLGAAVPGGLATVSLGARNALTDYMRPAIGTKGAVLDGSVPVAAADGSALTATPNQLTLAGNRIQSAATDPVAVRASLSEYLPGGPTREIVPGAAPTTFQATRDPGLGQLERGVSRSNAADFRARADAQNDARVAAVRGIADGADPTAVPATVQQFASGADAVAAQNVANRQAVAGQALDAIGGAYPAGSESTLGQMLRAPVETSLADTRARESALWNAIDPNGTLAVDMTPVRERASEIVRDIGPNAARPAGEEASILDTALGLPDTQSFSDLKDLRSRLTDAIRAAKQDPNRAQEARRLNMLLEGVHDTMEGSVSGQAAQDAAAVQAGTMAPEQSMDARMAAIRDAWYNQRANAVGTQAQASQGTVGRDAASGAGGFPAVRLGPRQAGGGFGDASSAQGVSEGQQLTPNFDAAAQARYAAARQATADRVATYRNAPGVGQVLQQGPAGFRTSDASVPNVIVKVGPQGADVAKAYIAAGGSPQALTDAAAYSLRQFAGKPDGTIDPGRFQTWAKQRSSFLSQLPDAANRFRTAADAQQAVNDAMAQRADLSKQMQKSALGKFLGNADPVTQVASIIRSPTAVADMRTLVRVVGSDPAAKAGLQRSVAEYVLRDLKGNAAGPTGAESYLKGDQLQTFLRAREPVLREVLSPEQMTSLRNVAESLEQSRLDTRVGAGSDTVQNANAPGGKAERLLSRIGHEIVSYGVGGSAGASIGTFVAGPAGGVVGGLLGAATGKAIQAAREAGIQNVDHLVAQAMLNPSLARVLLSKVTPKNEPALMSALADQLRKVSLVPATRADDAKRRAPTTNINRLLAP